MSFDNIPDELKARDQWLLYLQDKTPVNCDGYPINPTDRTKLVSFACAVECAHKFAGIGYSFQPDDDYTGIDLDNPYKLKEDGSYRYSDPAREQERIKHVYDTFNSYSELSPSGTGVHIIVRGRIGGGAKPSFTPIEMYDQERFFTFTGKVIDGRNTINTVDPETLNTLYEQLKPRERTVAATGRDELQHQSDEEVIAIASRTNLNFDALLRGELLHHSSASEACVHLMNIICSITQNRDQCRRIFARSPLGSRDKVANRPSLVEDWINMGFDLLPPKPDPAMFEAFAKAWQSGAAQPMEESVTAPESFPETREASVAASATPIPVAASNYSRPPGMLGEITDYIYSASQRPMLEIALSGAISLMAGLCGQQFNIGDSGLNYYLVCVAPASIGKEGARSGIRKLLRAANQYQPPNGPSAMDHLGPGAIQSGQALFNYMDTTKKTCWLTIQGEFGIKLQIMNAPNANGALKGLKDLYLDLYHQSHKGGMLNKSIYADTERSTDEVYSPALSIFGESTGEEFYKACSNNLVLSGFLTRFSIIDYTGPRVPRNQNAHRVTVPTSLAQRIYQLVAMNVAKRETGGPTMLEYAPDAAKVMEDWDAFCDVQYNASERDALRAMYGRAHIKAERLAGLIAVGINPHHPIICLQSVNWAIDFVKRDIRLFAKIVEDGRLGHSGEQSKDEMAAEELVKIIARYLGETFPKKPNPSEIEAEHSIGVVRESGLQPKVSRNGLFKDRDNKVTRGLKDAIKALEESGMLVRYAPENDKARAVRYQVADAAYFKKVYARLLLEDG